jgi:hypothetical protein
MQLRSLICIVLGRALFVVAVLTVGSVAAVAQLATGQMPSDPRGVSVIAAPPPDYNPVTGTAFANAQLALPPAPNPAIAPDAFAAWRNAVTAAPNREPSTLSTTNIFNGPIKRKRLVSGQPQAQ